MTRGHWVVLDIFVPGILTNPLNGPQGSWRKRWRWAKDWKERTCMRIFTTPAPRGSEYYAAIPKRVLFTLHVGHEWDSDALPAGVKPCRDALVAMRIIQDDKPSAGHTFEYAQTIHRGKGSREKRGVGIRVEEL